MQQLTSTIYRAVAPTSQIWRHNNFRVAKAFSPNVVKAQTVHFLDYYYRLEAKMKARYLQKV